MKHLMIDLETLATSEDAEILSIGFCIFTLDNDPVVEHSGSWTIRPQEERRRDPNTCRWWLKQGAAAQEALFNKPSVDLRSALISLRFLWADEKPDKVWANGVSFDLGILRHAYKATGHPVPWKYRQECCLRSVRALAPIVGLCYNRWYEDGDQVKHDAESDAIHQAEFLIEFWERARGAGLVIDPEKL